MPQKPRACDLCFTLDAVVRITFSRLDDSTVLDHTDICLKCARPIENLSNVTLGEVK